MRISRTLSIGAAALLLILSSPSGAMTIFDTISPTGVTTGGSGVSIGGVDPNYMRAASFVVAGTDSYLLTGIDLLLDGSNTIGIWSDSGAYPGELLGSATATFAGPDDLHTASFDGSILLVAGEQYWVSVSRDSGSSAWRYTSSGPYANGLRVNSIDVGESWNDSSPKSGSLYGFAVYGDVTVVPEPGTFAMLGLGLVAVGWRQRRR